MQRRFQESKPPNRKPGAEQLLTRTVSSATLVVVLLAFLLLAASTYYAQYSGSLRWILYALVVGAVGILAVRALRGSVQDPARLPAPAAATSIGGELTSLRTTLRRASDGLAYSQVLFEERMGDAFLEKVRVGRSVPDDALLAARRDPVALHALVGDADLEAFVLASAANARSYPSEPHPAKKDFAGRAASTLDRMEAWR